MFHSNSLGFLQHSTIAHNAGMYMEMIILMSLTS